MRVILAPDSFKGSVSAPQACEALAAGVRRVCPAAECVSIPMADGGEGTVAALVAGTGGEYRRATVTGPRGRMVEATYGLLGPRRGDAGAQAQGPTAVIEMAAAAGLPLLDEAECDPRETTTYGVGEMIADALNLGCRRFIVGIGGSATNDGGAGMAQALGVRFLDESGRPIDQALTGGLLAQVARIEPAVRQAELAECRFVVACDVDNPLLGRRGAARIYAPQKGADAAAVEQLEENMSHFADLMEAAVGRSVRATPGAGAAGGLGAGLLAFLGAELARGIDIVLDASRFEQRIAGADLVITGEGRLDGQTVMGKTISGVIRVAQRQGVPVVAVGGSLGPDYQRIFEIGLGAAEPLCPGPMSLSEAMRQAGPLLSDAAERVMRWVQLGQR